MELTKYAGFITEPFRACELALPDARLQYIKLLFVAGIFVLLYAAILSVTLPLRI